MQCYPEAESAEVECGAHLVAAGLPLDVVQDPAEGVCVAALVAVVAPLRSCAAILRAEPVLRAADTRHQPQLDLGYRSSSNHISIQLLKQFSINLQSEKKKII